MGQLASILQQLAGGALGGLGQRLSPGTYDAVQSQLNQQRQQQYEQAQQQNQFDQQMQLRNTLTADQQAQLQLQRQSQANTQGMGVWQLLTGGAQPTPTGQKPDFTYANQGFTAPTAGQTHTISKNSPIGKAIGLDEDITGLSNTEYLAHALPVMEKLSVAQDKQSVLDANSRAIDASLPTGLELIKRRFAPQFYQNLGQVDPMSDSLASDFTQRLQAAAATGKRKGDMAELQTVLKDLTSFESPWEKQRQQTLNRNIEVQARAAQNASTETDRSFQFTQSELNRIAQPVEQQARELGQLQTTLMQATPASDSLVIPQLIRAIGNMNRSSNPEMERVAGGRSGWETMKANLAHWSSDPSSATSITPAQRQQMMSLLGVVQSKVQSKLDSLNKGFSDLAGASSVAQHRQIFDRTRKSVSDLDSPASGGDPIDALVKRYGGQ